MTFPSGRLTGTTTALNAAWLYDRAYSRWLPVPRDYVSPDGGRYAYTEGDGLSPARSGKVHVVDLASGVDRVVYSGAPVFRVVDFAAEGIYLSPSPGEGYSRGLYIESPAGGSPRLISTSIVDPAVAGRDAWGLAFNAADPEPPDLGLLGRWNQLTRLDLVTGTSTSTFYHPGANVLLLGSDGSGSMLVYLETASGSAEIWLIAPSMAMRRLATFTSNGPGSVAAVDRHGVWFNGGHGPATADVWLYAGGVLRIVASVTSNALIYGAGGSMLAFLSLSIAGGCIP